MYTVVFNYGILYYKKVWGYVEEYTHTVEYSKHNKSEIQVRAHYCQNKAA